MKDIRVGDDVTKKSRGNELGTVSDWHLRFNCPIVTWLESGGEMAEDPDDLEIYRHGPRWTKKEIKALERAKRDA